MVIRCQRARSPAAAAAMEFRVRMLEFGENAMEFCENAMEFCENAMEWAAAAMESGENAMEFCVDALEFGENTMESGENAMESGVDAMEFPPGMHGMRGPFNGVSRKRNGVFPPGEGVVHCQIGVPTFDDGVLRKKFWGCPMLRARARAPGRQWRDHHLRPSCGNSPSRCG